ncbi:RpiB/LacA/LacB family sugar-phosphate isomerase [Nesterenkonia aurantiaca]|uniref:RpiB/LacA/LacB family sugar-phosphate isomerase n=1 Tax=Nesterenkonia aurantiaca TaxID=1436010 RepID=UPI003EE5A200
MGLRIAIGADLSGYQLKSALIDDLETSALVDDVHDVGVTSSGDTSGDHAQVALDVAHRIASGKADRGLLFCGNGLGVAIAANIVEGVDAVTAHDLFSVRTSITNNRAQVLCMGAKVIGIDLAREQVQEWLRVEMPA